MGEKIYARYERFWHWSQAILILILIVTGFEVHGNWKLFGYNRAVSLHEWVSFLFILLTLFTIFWHATTGEWKQYKPTRKFLKEYLRFYSNGIFKGENHPTHKHKGAKLNPLQRLTYLSLKMVLIPGQVATGLLYFLYPVLKSRHLIPFGLEGLALIHVLGAFLFIAFMIAHIYLSTTGDTLTSNIKEMITGYERKPNPRTN